MSGDDPAGYAELWLSEMGAWVPGACDGVALAPLEIGFGLYLPEQERARRHGARLGGEASTARAHRDRRRA